MTRVIIYAYNIGQIIYNIGYIFIYTQIYYREVISYKKDSFNNQFRLIFKFIFNDFLI